MNFYKLAIFGNPLKNLTYCSKEELHVKDVVKVELQNRQKSATIIEQCEKPEFACKEIIGKIGYFNDALYELATFISKYYVCSLGEAFSLMNPFTCKEKLTSHALSQQTGSEVLTSPIKPHNTILSGEVKTSLPKKKLTLSKDQQEAKDKLNVSSILFGDTGSGKTEVYISMMEDVLKKGKNVIFLMPEISLTPQMKKRLTKHFGSLVAIYHSKITKKKKLSILEDLQSGKIRIIAGARSALFLPIKDVALIIVDEEHDDSYKSSSNPRYNAKDVALVYGKILHAKVILGSATPSFTSYAKLPSVRLEGTFFETKKSFIYENAQNEITPFMLQRIEKTLNQNNQVIIFVPTRANFKYLTCKSCGESIKCPFCEVGMSLHSGINALKCHYCNFTMKIPTICPACKGDLLEANRIGTAQIAKELQEVFSTKNIQIFDRDVVKTQKNLKAVLKDFNDKSIDILVGTQMLSKGHDYHDVALSVVLGLDSILNQPDFKAREKALSLAIQVAGRSGRKGEGEVFIQTKNMEFFKLYISDYERFLKDELPFRQNLYPPYKKLLRLQITHAKKSVCQDITNALVQKINSLTLKAEIVGHGESNITKIASKYRYEVLLRSSSAKTLIQIAHICKQNHVQIDMDPLSFS